MARKTAREIAAEITEGIRKPQHIGKKTPQVLAQEIFSIINTKKPFRGTSWRGDLFQKKRELFLNYGISNWRLYWQGVYK